MKPHHIIEIAGMIFLFIAIVFEFFNGNILDYDENTERLKGVLARLDQLHYRQYMLEGFIERKIQHYQSETVPGVRLSDKWDSGTYPENHELIERQSGWLKRKKLVILVLGTMLVLLAKIIESSQPK